MNPEGGYTRQYRRMWDNPVFRSYQEAAVFSWMKDTAQWCETTIRTKFGPVKLGVGELLMAERPTAEAFGLHRNTLRSLIHRMVAEGMIEPFLDRCPQRAGTVYLIKNYKVYQGINEGSENSEDRKRTANGTGAGPQEDRKRTKNKEENKIKELTKEADASLGADGADDGQPQSDEDDPSPPLDQPTTDDPSDPTDAELVWGRGLQWLAKSTGKKPDQMRGLVGRWCKGGREAVVLALMRECREHSPPIADPVPWIETALANRSEPNVRQAQGPQQHRPSARSYGEDPAARRPGVLDGLAHRLDPSGAAAAGGPRPTASAGRVG
ncbi:hypothetical protein ABNQ39_00040 (plasmid) [Azospirillum sp. A26]|uniref:hypothetical protein n=1 Tax=Azospirillum sp. A26 TaxID=3160607 RepID=UPI00366D7E65